MVDALDPNYGIDSGELSKFMIQEILKGRIYSLFHHHNATYGYRRIHSELRKQGYVINAKKIQRIMGEMNLKAGKHRTP